MISSLQTFGQANFGDAQLGDKRRTKRLVRLADLMVRRPAGTLPQKFAAPKDLRAFYRLMNCDEVTHEAIIEPHRQATRRKINEAGGTVLVIHDATELDFTNHRSLSDDLGQIGNGTRRGYIVQNSLAVHPKTRQILGLYNQVVHRREDVPKDELTAEKRMRESRESRLWMRGTDPLDCTSKLVDICDRGADTFEFIEHEVASGRRFVIRANHNRKIIVGHSDDGRVQSGYLRTYASELPAAGHWELLVTSKTGTNRRRRKGKKTFVKRIKRNAKMAVSFAPLQIKAPGTKLGDHGSDPLAVWVIRVWEVEPPAGQERLEWFLITNEAILDFEDAYRVVGWYECRWTVEEFHKGMKTGCSIESPQFTSDERLQPAIALISIVAQTLLQMRDASRGADAKKRKATEIICKDYIAVLSAWRHGRITPDWSIHEFFYALARLGGHQNRKSDHPPGWQIIWRGWNDLQAMLFGVDAMKMLSRSGKT